MALLVWSSVGQAQRTEKVKEGGVTSRTLICQSANLEIPMSFHPAKGIANLAAPQLRNLGSLLPSRLFHFVPI